MAGILIVDGSSYSRRLLRTIVEEGGHEVLEAPDGPAGLALYTRHAPDVVLLDLTAGGPGREPAGLGTLRALRAAVPPARVVVAAADLSPAVRALVEDAGAVGFVERPFSPAAVLAALRSALRETGGP